MSIKDAGNPLQSIESTHIDEGKSKNHEPERIHKNSMEEWETRLSVAKAKVSVVDRLVEKNTCEPRDKPKHEIDLVMGKSKLLEKTQYGSDQSVFQVDIENKSLTKKSHLLKMDQPKSLDLDRTLVKKNFSVYASGIENENLKTKEEKSITHQKIACTDIKPRKKSKSENLSRDEDKNEKCSLHTLPKVKNVRKRGILKKSIYSL